MGQALAGNMQKGDSKNHLDWGFELRQEYKSHQMVVYLKFLPFIVCTFYLKKLYWSLGRDLHAKMFD